jgi:hypothetical protein
MNPSAQIAKHLRDVHFGGNWTAANLKDALANVTWQDATTQVYSLNTIVRLTYHINYYVSAVLGVLQGQPLTAKDKFSFDHPPVSSQQDWEALLNKLWTEADSLASIIEQLPEEKLEANFADEKYGNYYRNLHGLIEHTHYHLGQIVLIKKILARAAGKRYQSLDLL